MENSTMVETGRGLSLRQWSVLLIAFMLGVGGVYILREIFPPNAANAAVVHKTAAFQAPGQLR
jgi:hypothetical protein